jgi:protein-L-isoaspartate(D-aspartate) O-methyltransferase
MTKKEGKLVREPLRPTLFVPMTGEAEENRQQQPDAANPRAVNGDFEIAATGDGASIKDYVPGWYYGRQVRRMELTAADGSAPQGTAYVRFSNETPGLSSHLLQGIAIDGREVSMIRLSGQVRTNDIRKGPDPDSMPMIAISLYDEQRRDLGAFWLGPFRSTRPWRSSSRLIRIPPATREAILRVGLFGATGTADFDEIAVERID